MQIDGDLELVDNDYYNKHILNSAKLVNFKGIMLVQESR